MQYSAGFAINQNLEDTTTSFDGRNSAEGVSSANKSVVVDNIKLVPNILLKVLKWGFITILFLILVVLSLGSGAALYVCSRYGKGDSSCFRKLIEVWKFCCELFCTLNDIEDQKSVMHSADYDFVLGFCKELLRKNINKLIALLKPLVNNFSDIFNTENIVNDLFAVLNQKALLEKLKKLLGAEFISQFLTPVLEKFKKGEISAEGVNDKLKELGEKFTFEQFLSVLGIELPPLFKQMFKQMQDQDELDLPENFLNANQFGERLNTSGIREQEDFSKHIQERDQKCEEMLRSQFPGFFKLKDQFDKTGGFGIGSAD